MEISVKDRRGGYHKFKGAFVTYDWCAGARLIIFNKGHKIAEFCEPSAVTYFYD